ncbi:VanZ family protein [Clostridium sp. YIM B02505]|uniref:VanZ family protein n=1 Tax=Clostridium yunnanense TaxID=2800325 RepID=A0ABS1EUZ8_9CLOT|nr:VanZ family protein [Clostridium yunnanense]MBK1813149.1 VanZ family protein [Clostridium yunnanense]
MRILEVIGIAKKYLLIGGAGILLLSIIMSIAYFIIYKRLLKGTKTIKVRQAVLYCMLLLYTIIVLGATVGMRSSMNDSINMHLFSSYIEAWNNFSKVNWRYIILNILMFVPLGFMLPMTFIKCRKWYMTYFIGFLCTVAIEIIQLVTGRGVFELDDMFNNTLGCMIGYGIVMIFILLIVDKHKKASLIDKKRWTRSKWLTICSLQIPLCITIIAFSIIFISYSKQELGNLSAAFSYRQNMANTNISTKVKFKDIGSKAYVYKASVGTKEDTLKVASKILGAVNTKVDEARSDAYDETTLYYSKDKNCSVWVYYTGLIASYSNLDHNNSAGLIGLKYEEVKKILEKFPITLPDKVDFVDKGKGRYEISVAMAKIGDNILDGELTCNIADNKDVVNFDNRIISYSKYKEYEIISEQEAYNKILEGKFNAYSLKDKLEIKDVKLVYKVDSKGFYQPVYEFTLEDKDRGSILIPALKQ